MELLKKQKRWSNRKTSTTKLNINNIFLKLTHAETSQKAVALI